MILTVTNQKGGVGKTTLSMNLATYWLRQGRRVAVIDADPQRSSERWAARAATTLGKGALPGVYFCHDGTELEEACARLRASHDVIVIDTPPTLTATGTVSSAIQVADAILLPIRPSILDLDSLGDVRRLIEGERRSAPPVLVVVSLARSSCSATREVRHSVRKLGYPCAKTVIHERAAHARAALTGSLWELPPAIRKPATGEIAELAAELEALLASAGNLAPSEAA